MVSERWSIPSLTYCCVSSTTIPEPLSALLMTRVLSVLSSLRACFSLGVKFGVTFRGCINLVSVLILFRYFSIIGEADGGIHSLFGLNGCGSVGGRLRKKNLILLLLSKLSRESGSWVSDEVLLGTKDRPKEKTYFCGGVKVLDERLVMYLSLFRDF